ncbi:hypothetical protein MTO96_023679 [Rhipicephalus appendiculatus]
MLCNVKLHVETLQHTSSTDCSVVAALWVITVRVKAPSSLFTRCGGPPGDKITFQTVMIHFGRHRQL